MPAWTIFTSSRGAYAATRTAYFPACLCQTTFCWVRLGANCRPELPPTAHVWRRRNTELLSSWNPVSNKRGRTSSCQTTCFNSPATLQHSGLRLHRNAFKWKNPKLPLCFGVRLHDNGESATFWFRLRIVVRPYVCGFTTKTDNSTC